MASRSDEPRTIVDHNRNEQRYQDERSLRDRIRETIERCSKALGRGRPQEYHAVAVALRDRLYPMLETFAQHELLAYDNRLADEAGWDGVAFTTFRRRADAIVATLAKANPDADSIAWRVDGYVDGETAARHTTAGALNSVAAIAAHEGAVADRFNNEADAMGFAVQLGVHKQRADMDFGDPVSAIRRDLGALKHFYTGGTSGGKSSGASRQFEDYYRASVGRGRNYKCIDPVGITTENVNAYDIPQQDGTLRHAREEHGLPPDWTGIDDYDPEAEFLIPLTPDLDGYELPYDTVDEEFVPTPFTIPASDLSEGLLSAAIAARVSKGEQKVIRQAYRDVGRRHEDWSLYDLERAIQSRDDLSDSDKESAARIVKNLASEGFIRTAEDEYAFDDGTWSELFHSTDVITVFNQAHLQNDLSKYLVLAWLIDQIWTRRNRAHNNPDLVCWLRELHLVVPHQQHRRRLDDAVQNVVEYIVSVLNKIMRMPRDINTHVVADTQDPNDPEKGIRKRFNRYVVFGGSDDDLKSIFSWAGQNNWRSLKNTISGEPGHAGIIKGCEPAVGPNRWGISPVHLTPPSWHHHDKDEGPSGWQKRVTISQDVDVMNDEQLRDPAGHWGLNAPDRDDIAVLEFEGGEDDEQDEEPDDPVEQLGQDEIAKMQARQQRAHTDKGISAIIDDIPDNPETGKPYARSTVHGWIEDIDKGSGELVLDIDQ